MSVSLRLLALAVGFGLDLLLGDPHWLPHPVRAIGWLIDRLEPLLRRIFPKTKGGERAAGTALVLLVLAISTGLTVLLLWLCGMVSPALRFAAEAVICYQLLATKSLADESRKVYTALTQAGIEAARRAVSMIVGRDTAALDAQGVAKATVETVAENASDGVIAPLLFLALGGAPLGMLYKASNTMDSMVGYQNERYQNFGRSGARWDDLLNFVPARLAGLMMAAAAAAGFDGKNALRIFLRDRKHHKSPNSAHTEAAAAGALHIQLGGGNYYFGQWVEKETIGDPDRPVEAEDILKANRLLYATALLALVVVAAAGTVVCALLN